MINKTKKTWLVVQAFLNPAVPSRLKYEIGGCLLYFISPIDSIPDFIPFTGKVDDLVVILWGVKRLYDVIKIHKQHQKSSRNDIKSTPEMS